MASKIPADKKRVSVILPRETCEVITATAQIYNCNFSDMVNRILNNFASRNKIAISIADEMHKRAQYDISPYTEFDFDSESSNEKAAE